MVLYKHDIVVNPLTLGLLCVNTGTNLGVASYPGALGADWSGKPSLFQQDKDLAKYIIFTYTSNVLHELSIIIRAVKITGPNNTSAEEGTNVFISLRCSVTDLKIQPLLQ